MKIGIDSIAYYVPELYLDIETLALARDIEPAKLQKGLGLSSMALLDTDQDTATMGAEAALRLIEQSGVDPREIGRIYLGTESALDSAKPTATYIAQILDQAFSGIYGDRPLRNCDVVDMTFACVGGVDALHNSIDWVRAGRSRKAIVIASDFAKYTLGSAGEYTQGAGAVAMLVCEDPRLCCVGEHWGVGMDSVGDFYKPQYSFSKREIFTSAIKATNIKLDKTQIDEVFDALGSNDFWGHKDANILLHRDEPVFDGPFSNDCYCARITEALSHLQSQKEVDMLEDWSNIAFHLPYAYQGRRMIVENWIQWYTYKGQLAQIEQQVGFALDNSTTEKSKEFAKAAAKTAMYKDFVDARIERSERASTLIGNMYTGSIFMALISILRCHWQEGTDLTGSTIGCFSYGSGSKSKVFELTVQNDWKGQIKDIDIFTELDKRTQVDLTTYELLHRGILVEPIIQDKRIKLDRIGQGTNDSGLRYYSVKK